MFPRLRIKTTGEAVPDFALDLIESESSAPSWTLMHRYNNCASILNSIDIESEDDVYLLIFTKVLNRAWVYICLKLSAMRLLDWQRCYNTQPRDLTSAQNNIARTIVEKIISLRDKKDGEQGDRYLKSQDLLRQSLGLVGKGGINGQEIRDEILRIFHRYKIEERANHFYEQWHQKLHNNTNPDDIVICEALLAYLKSNDMTQYWRVINAGGLTKERLQTYDRKIDMEPYYAPEYIPGFENFLVILKKAHSATDLVILADQVNGKLNSDLNKKLGEIVSTLGDWDTIKLMERITWFRRGLGEFVAAASYKDLLVDCMYLDLGMEYYQRQLVEKVIHIDVGLANYFKEISLLLDNIIVSYKWREVEICREELQSRAVDASACDKNYYSALKVKAVIERLKRCLGEVVERSQAVLQSKAERMGNDCHCNPDLVAIFTEEVIRGSLFFALSMVVKKVEPTIRKTLGSQTWLIISPLSSAAGRVIFVKRLKEAKTKYTEPTVILTESIGGEEEIPEGVTAVVLVKNSDYPDVLAHVSVRARNGKVLLAACLETEGPTVDGLMKLLNGFVRLTVGSSGVEAKGIEKLDAEEKTMVRRAAQEVVVPTEEIKEYCIKSSEFSPLRVGAKSNNLNKIRGKIEDWILLPQSIALQFNSFEDMLNLPSNEPIKVELEATMKTILNAEGSVSPLLEKCRSIVMKLPFPEGEKGEKLAAELQTFGVAKEDVQTKAWTAIKSVYASKFNERAYLATRKIGVPLDHIRMAVLVQKVVPAEYAFVVHTKNPTNNCADEIYVEVVRGMGETLVGSYAGQSFSFTINKSKAEV